MIGKRKGYYHLRQYYEKRVTGDLNAAIAEYFPPLCRGIIGSAVHGLIYLGYGKAVQCKQTVTEGLAYLHFANMPLETDQDLKHGKIGQGNEDIVDVVNKVKISRLHEFMMKKIEEAPWDTFCTSFQRNTAVLFTCKPRELLHYVYQIKFPENLLDEKLSLHERARHVGKWLVDIAITVYTTSEERNDFFLIHGVTSAWALYQLLPCLKTHEDITEAATVFLSLLLGVYVCQGCPTLNLTYLSNEKATSASWEEIIAKTLNPPKDDEHIYKLVQVCYDMSREGDLPLYKVAAHLALDYNLL